VTSQLEPPLVQCWRLGLRTDLDPQVSGQFSSDVVVHRELSKGLRKMSITMGYRW